MEESIDTEINDEEVNYYNAETDQRMNQPGKIVLKKN